MLHKYESMDDVKDELSWLVAELKALQFKRHQVPFLTESAEIENRKILGKGTSKLSGNYVIEESTSRDKNGEEQIYRRLVFEQVRVYIVYSSYMLFVIWILQAITFILKATNTYTIRMSNGRKSCESRKEKEEKNDI